jgi:hypothetical protein
MGRKTNPFYLRIVHNHAGKDSGYFRAWTVERLPPRFQTCPCGWLEGARHYADAAHIAAIRRWQESSGHRPPTDGTLSADSRGTAAE